MAKRAVCWLAGFGTGLLIEWALRAYYHRGFYWCLGLITGSAAVWVAEHFNVVPEDNIDRLSGSVTTLFPRDDEKH